jgi:glucokinase
MLHHAMSIDIGATKIAAAVVRSDAALLGASQVSTPQTDDAEIVFRAVTECAVLAGQESGIGAAEIVGLGCSVPGPMQWPAGVVSAIKIPAWREFPLRDRLIARFPGQAVRVHNDGIALSVGEHWAGRAAGSNNMLAITVSTGVGGGLILNNQLFHGKSGNAGHVGHLAIDSDGPACGCGGRGCLETVASGPAAVSWAQDQGWRPRPGMGADGAGLAESAELGDAVAGRALYRAGAAVGQAAASLANALDLDCIVIAGGFSRSGRHFWDALQEAFAEHAMSFARMTRIEKSDVTRNSGLLGAAGFVLFPDRYGWII